MNKEKSKDKYCTHNKFKRARYFHGMLMTERDFEDEQLYHIEKRKLVNRMLHGWGVVCGLEIVTTLNPSLSVIIRPGLALDCRGNELYLPEEYLMDIGKILKPGLDQEVKKDEAYCAQTDIQGNPKKWYVLIKYDEKPSDSVPVYAQSGNCEEKECDYSRIREGLCFELTDTKPCPDPEDPKDPCFKPDPTKTPTDKEKRNFYCQELTNPCPAECCDEPVVVLGSISFDGDITKDTKIEPGMINNCDCRRLVMTFGLLQHWMTLLAPLVPAKITYDDLKDFAFNKENKDLNKFAEIFETGCNKTTPTEESEKISSGKKITGKRVSK